MTVPADAWYRAKVVERFDSDEVQVDPEAPVSRAEDQGGAWVQAWVWVEAPAEEAEDGPL